MSAIDDMPDEIRDDIAQQLENLRQGREAKVADVEAAAVGLIDKFTVTKNYDPDLKHEGCKYFVLDPQHDPIALEALRFYASRAGQVGYFALASDLMQWVAEVKFHDHLDEDHRKHFEEGH